jgi:orotate phosphoribosyltransferase
MALSYPPVRNFLREQMVAAIQTHFPSVEVIAGVATGAIALAALVAQDLGLPMVYVRPTAKEHGRQNQVEGHLEGHRRVVVVEDLISTGKSSLAAVEALRQQYAQVLGMVGIFTYGFPQADEAFAAAFAAMDVERYRLTVTGMMRTFKAITIAGVGNPAAMASGIAEALITTATGLIVAIPALIAHRYLRGRVDRLVVDMEKEAMKLVQAYDRLQASGAGKP